MRGALRHIWRDKVTELELLNGLKLLVEAALPGETVHTNRVREGFTRPASLVQCGKLRITPLNACMSERQQEMILTSFVEVDAYHDSHFEDLVTRQEKLLAIFADSYIRIGSRCPHVEKLEASYGLDYTEVKATLCWDEVREEPEKTAAAYYTINKEE